MPDTPLIAIEPAASDGLVRAVEEGGGRVVGPGEAQGLVWTNPGDAEGLKEVLASSSVSWVQLPFAGIEKFVEAGAVDPKYTWTCCKGVYGHACAEHALALMLSAARCLHVHARAKAWVQPGFGSPERRLKDATVLIVGTGGIGAELVPMLQPLGVRILAVNRSGRPLSGAERTEPQERLSDLVGDADYIVLTPALTPETRGMVDMEFLGRMKPDAWIVNVARGGLIDTDALIAALENEAIGGAALDVTDPEPLPEGHRLWELGNAIITPHIANTWDMAIPELEALVRRNVAHFAAGEPLEGPVDPQLGY